LFSLIKLHVIMNICIPSSGHSTPSNRSRNGIDDLRIQTTPQQSQTKSTAQAVVIGITLADIGYNMFEQPIIGYSDTLT